jgi:hypothetical protein
MAHRDDLFHPLPALPSTATGSTRLVPAYRDRETATWYLLDPEERICLYCALPASQHAHAACVTPSVAHVFAPRGLATARHALFQRQQLALRIVEHQRHTSKKFSSTAQVFPLLYLLYL